MAASTPEERIHEVYGFAFPVEFFRFCELLDRLPAGLLGDACGMHPGFPFGIAEGSRTRPQHSAWEDRYYHDLPEFITLFTGTVDGLHFGYVFDSPGELPPVIAHYWHSDTFEHTIDGDSLFVATRSQIEQSENDYLESMEEDPDDADYCREQLEKLATLRAELSSVWGADRTQTGEEYVNAYGGSSWRKPVARTWDGLGIVVPEALYDRLSADPFTGYRVDPQRLQVEGLAAEALRLLEAGRPGAALKLGRDLWVWAREFPECYDLLDAAYSALGREPLRSLMAEARGWREDCDRRR